jgi:hypothetical protein
MAYTSHGHRILHSTEEPPFFGKIHACGGPGMCAECTRESSQYNHPSNTNRKKEA